jgi:hypothetical protein
MSTAPTLPPLPEPSFAAPAWAVAKRGPVDGGGWFSADQMHAYAITHAAAIAAERDALKQEVEALRVDAERYRHLRVEVNGCEWERYWDERMSALLDGVHLDRAIDAAIGERQ